MIAEIATFPPEARERLEAYLARPGYEISRGLGTEDAACSIAAINLAIDGRLITKIPACMSAVIGRWIITIQDGIPSEMRNAPDWRALLPDAAGTGRDPETEGRRLDLIMDWMWDALARVQPVADEGGFGEEWRTMCEKRTAEATNEADEAACAALAANAARAAARAADDAALAADAARSAWAADDPSLVADAARASACAALAADTARAVAGARKALDPSGTLKRLIDA